MHEKYMKMAIAEASGALARGEFPVGCVIVGPDGLICTGRRKKSKVGNELEHAEIQALREVYRNFPEVSTDTLTVYSTMEPCLMCFATLIVNNIDTIVYSYEDVMGGGTNVPLDMLSPLYAEKKITIIKNVLRSDSLKLFKEFFHNQENEYLRDSLLATHTLAQN